MSHRQILAFAALTIAVFAFWIGVTQPPPLSSTPAMTPTPVADSLG